MSMCSMCRLPDAPFGHALFGRAPMFMCLLLKVPFGHALVSKNPHDHKNKKAGKQDSVAWQRSLVWSTDVVTYCYTHDTLPNFHAQENPQGAGAEGGGKGDGEEGEGMDTEPPDLQGPNEEEGIDGLTPSAGDKLQGKGDNRAAEGKAGEGGRGGAYASPQEEQ
eukprot:scaffold225681_cov15-Tisochrysis_lutea.AAC.1